MDIRVEKLRLIDQIALVQDEGLIKALKSLLDFGLQPNRSTIATGFWEELNAAQKKQVKKSIRQLDADDAIPELANLIELQKKEELMRLERIEAYESSLKPMTLQELEQEILEAVEDYKAGKYVGVEELMRQMETW